MSKLVRLLGLWLALCTAGAQAQMVERNSVDTQVWSCLQKGGEPLHYTHEERSLQLGGLARLSLKFTAPDKAPEVEVLYSGLDDALMQKLLFHLSAYRLPCFVSGSEPVVAVQEFRFEPKASEAIAWTQPRAVSELDAEIADRNPGAFDCMRWPQERPELVSAYGMPYGSTNFVVDFTFDHPQQPAKLKIAYSSVSKAMEQRLIEYAKQYRMPCVVEGGKPRGARQHFKFSMAHGDGSASFKKELSLREFLSSIKGINSEKVNFDFRTMTCPFQVAWTLGKPALDNAVGEVGKPDLNRTEFLAWLTGLEMNLQKPDFEELMGTTLRINVSCGRLSLGQTPAPAGS